MSNTSDDLYDLVPESKPAPRPVAPKPVIAYRTAGTADTMPAKAEPEEIRNLWMPIWLLGGGILIEVAAALLTHRHWTVGLTVVGIQVILGTAVLLAGVIVAARFRGINLGSSWPIVALKLAAIAMAPDALETLLSPVLSYVPLGGLIGWVVSFVLYFALLGVFFDLDESDTWYCVWVIFLVRLAIYFALLFTLLRWL